MTNISTLEIKIPNQSTLTDLFECQICYDFVDPKLNVKCLFCKQTCCQDCFQQYILTTELKPLCMFCGKDKKNKMNFEIDFIILNTDKEWFQTIYKNYRTELLWKEETIHLKEITIQKEARAYMDANIFRYSTCANGILEIGDMDLDQRIYHSENLEKIRKAKLTVQNSIICIEQYGKGWADFDFGKSEPRSIINMGNASIPCPSKNCHGIISDETCDLCGCTICRECHEIIKNISHKCDPNTVASIKAVHNGSHPCPKCATPIFKIDGCDQMFCTQCHTSFSWRTGLIVTKGIHNPHYFDWLRKSGQLAIPERLAPGENCEEYISYANLLSCFSKLELDEAKQIEKKVPQITRLIDELPSIYHYVIAFKNFRNNILNVRATSGNHANVTFPDNHDTRVKFLTNEIDIEMIRKTIEEHDFEFQKMLLYWQIYSTIFQFATILFDNLFTFTHQRTKVKLSREKFMYDLYIQFQNILEYGNKCLTYYDKVFGKDKRLIHFQRHPYINDQCYKNI